MTTDSILNIVIIVLIIVLIILIVLDIWTLLRVPAIAQQKGYNVYAWIGLACFFGIISYFILKGLKNKSITANQKSLSIVKTPKTANNFNQQKVSYSAWVCPKCGEKNSYAAKNCINCFEPRP